MQRLAGISQPVNKPSIVGASIQEAIDWAQDRLGTTRPLAERVLFEMIQHGVVVETADGFLCETSDEDSKKAMFNRLHHHLNLSARPRHMKMAKQVATKIIKKLEESIEDEIEHKKSGLMKYVDDGVPHDMTEKPIEVQEERLEKVHHMREKLEDDLRHLDGEV